MCDSIHVQPALVAEVTLMQVMLSTALPTLPEGRAFFQRGEQRPEATTGKKRSLLRHRRIEPVRAYNRRIMLRTEAEGPNLFSS